MQGSDSQVMGWCEGYMKLSVQRGYWGAEYGVNIHLL